MPVVAVRDKPVTTLEGLAEQWRRAKRIDEPGRLHPVQQAFIDEQAMQCGYCSNGWIMNAAAMLDGAPDLDDAAIRRALSGLKCRCGAHMSILRAVKRAARTMA